jgi:choline dehydrogenase-like flavoprotein
MIDRDATLDARLRRHFAGIDTAADFEARITARVAALRAAPASDLRAQFELRRERLRRRLRREAWLNGATIAGIAAAAGAVLWRYAPDILAWPARLDAGPDPDFLVGIGLVAIVLGLWPQLQRLLARL